MKKELERKEKRKERKRDVQTFDFSLQFQSGVYILPGLLFFPQTNIIDFLSLCSHFFAFFHSFFPVNFLFLVFTLFNVDFSPSALKNDLEHLPLQRRLLFQFQIYFSFRCGARSVSDWIEVQLEFSFSQGYIIIYYQDSYFSPKPTLLIFVPILFFHSFSP